MAITIRAGFGKGIVRFPESMFPVEGFACVHDDPHVRLMVLQLKDVSFALLEAELVIVPQSLINVWRNMIAQAFHMPVQQVTVQITHAISTPHEPGPLGPPEIRPEPTEEDLRKRANYREATEKAVIEAIGQAKEDLSDAVFGWGSGECGVNVNCDMETPFGWWIGPNSDEWSNHTMSVMRVNDLRGALKGIFVSFGMKPASIDNAGRKENKRQVSSDVAGVFCERMEEAYGVPVIYSVSAGGNQVPRQSAIRYEIDHAGEVRELDEGVEHGMAYAAEQGKEMCAACKKIVDSITCGEDASTASWAECSVTWEGRKGGERKLRKEVPYIPEGETELTADLFRLGASVFVMIRPEMTAECERFLLDKSPADRTVLMTLTNGEMKCVPDQVSFVRGTFEAQGSNMMPGAAEALMDTVIRTLKTM